MLCPRLVGRADESLRLSAALDGLQDGRGACLFLLGEPGIGKSRLADEAAAEAEKRGAWVLYGRASPTGRSVPYQSLSGAVLHGLRARPLQWLPKDVQGVRAGLATLLPGLVEGPSVEPSPVLLAETVLRLVAALGGQDGALIVLEDLHWACGDTLAVTEYLADNAATERVVVLGTSRPEGSAVPVIDALERRGSAEVTELRRLNAREVEEMTACCLESGPEGLPEGLGEVLEARADGLPFVVEELLAGLVSRGALVASESGWELRGEPQWDVPMSFSETVSERLAELSPPERRVIEFAALLGRDFDWFHLPRVAHLDEAEVLDSLARAVDLQLVEETGGDHFRFRHVLTVEAILAHMLVAQRARLAAEALDDLLEDPERIPSELLELAAHLAAQAGRGSDASRYRTEEAKRALSKGALATAIATARRARRSRPSDSPEAIAAGEVLLSALSLAGDTVGADEVGRELLERFHGAGADAERVARVQLLLARAAHAALDLDRARRLCEEALALEPRDRRLRIELDLVLAEVAFSEHQHAASAAGADAALADADDAGFDDLASDALELLGRHRMFVALDLKGAEPYLLESLRRAELAGLPLATLRALQRLAFHDLATGAGRARMELGRDLALELGALAMVAEFEHLLATHYLIAAEFGEAEVHTERALRETRRYGLMELTVLLLGLRATISAVRGNRVEAEAEAAEAFAAAESVPIMRAAVNGTPLVVAALADDDLATAARRVSETRAVLPDRIVFWPPFLGSFYGVASVVLAASGARELVEGRDWAELDDVYQHSSFCVAQAIVAGRTGDADRAAALFAEGDGGLVSVPWVRALYRRYAGQAALNDRWGDPARWLVEAERYFESSGNEPLERACRSLLRLAGTSPRRRRSAPAEPRYPGLELTTREADVLALVAEGLTNKEIAGRLYLSPRTVEKHVERILTKTEQPNRTALAAFAAEQQPVAPAT